MSFKRIAFYTVGLLAFLGLQPAVAEEIYFYQSPARITVDVIESVNDTDLTTLQPSKADSAANRYYHDLTVNVYINGDTSTVDYVAACVYSPNLSVSVDSACGYETADTTGSVNDTSYPDTNPEEVISFRWEGTDASNPQSADWKLDGQGVVDHLLDADSSGIVITTDNTQTDSDDNTLTMTKLAVTFRFALSHATANETNWKVRAAVGSTSTGPNGADSTDDDKQFRAEELDTTKYGIYFFGAFATSTDAFRPSVNYGALTQNSSTIETGIITGQYWANDSVDIAIAGTDFTFTSGGGTTDTIPLAENAIDAVTDNKAVRLTCTGTNPDSTSDFSGPGGAVAPDSDAVVVRSSIDLASDAGLIASQDILLTGQVASGEDPIFAAPHRCKLEYGVGATFADNVYTNQVTLGMIDADTSDTITAGLFGIADDNTRSYPTITRPES